MKANRSTVSALFLLTVALMKGPAYVLAQGTVEGFVRSRTGEAVANAFVEARREADASVAASATSDRFGFFRFRVDSARYTLRVTRLGFEELTLPLEVKSSGVTRLDLTLEERALEVSALTVEAQRSRRNFEENAGQTSRELSRGELKAIPGLAESDVLRAIEVLPGVVTTSDFSSAFNVRGGSADQNLITIDGFPVFNPFHLGGLFSVFSADMVSRAELIAGGFPAQYSGRVSSVLNVESDPGETGFDARAGVSLLATRVALGADLPTSVAEKLGFRSGRGRLSVRRSYFDQLFRPFFDFPYHLTDVQGYGELWSHGGGRLSFTGYTGRDVLDFVGVDSFPLKIRWQWGNDLAGLRWLQHSERGYTLDVRGGFTRFKTALAFPEFGDTRFRSQIRQGFLKADFGIPAARGLELRAGVEANRYSYANIAESGGTVFRQGHDISWLAGLYTQATWRPRPDWLIEAGARLDNWSSSRDYAVLQPRLALKHFLDPYTALKLAVGRYGQFLHSIRDEELPLGIDVWVTTGERAPRLVSDQVQGGLELFRGAWYAALEGFYRGFDGVAANNIADDPNTAADDLLAGDGVSYGADALLRRDAGKVRGFLSVSWLKAERTFPDFTTGIDPAPEITYAPVFDRRLDIDLVLRTTLPRSWELGARLNFGSGLPYTKPDGAYLFYEYHLVDRGRRQPSAEPDSARTAILLGQRNGARYPAYHRLDVSLRKTMQRSWGQLTPYLDVLNVLNRKNVLFYFYEYDKNPPIRSGVSMFPLLPTLGVEVVF